MNYDLAIIGSGPGGYAAALRATQLGDKVALIEKAELGGTCLNRGCIPTKALLASLEVYELSKRALEFGIEVNPPALNWKKVLERKEKIIFKLRQGLENLLKKNKVEIIQGEGFVKEPGLIEVRQSGGLALLRSKNIILATGSRPHNPFGFGLTSDQALNLTEIPAEITIIGGGAIGCEFAQIFNSAGSQVRLIEALPHLLPNLDEDLGKALALIFQKRGIEVLTNTEMKNEKKEMENKTILVAIGRKADKVETGPGIYAIGDITGKPQLAHLASRQGVVTVENLHGLKSSLNYNAVPACVYTNPEIASVGISEGKSAKYPIRALAKAQIMGELDGFIKIVADEKTKQVLGVHILAPQAINLISEATLAIENGLKTEDLIKTIHPHPVLSEGIPEAAGEIFGKRLLMRNL